MAAKCDHFDICVHLYICKLIIANIQDKNPASNDGTTPLHLAAGMCHEDICKLIIANVPNKNPSGRNGETPLHLAAHQGLFDLFKFIFELVPDKNPVDFDGNTPLHRAARGHWDIYQLVIEGMLNDNLGSIQGHQQIHPVTGQIYELIIENPKNNEGKTPLDLTTQPKIWEYIDSLVEKENSTRKQKLNC